MFEIKDFLDKMFLNYKIKNQSESIYSYKIAIEATDVILSAYADLDYLLSELPYRDHICFSMHINNAEPETITSYDLDRSDFINKFIDLITYHKDILFEEGDIYNCNITINKSESSDAISIYYLKLFINYLDSLSIDDLNNLISSLENNNTVINFNLINDNINFYTQKFNFYFDVKNRRCCRISKFDEILSNSREIVNFVGYNNFKLIPDYFYLVKRSNRDDYNKWFDKLSIIISFCYLTNLIEYNKYEHKIDYKLNGYKTIFGSIDLKKHYKIEHLAVNQYFKIYNWVYSDSHITDKIGLARNILSIHINNYNIFCLKDDLFTSINACYDIYLKENFDKYIEVKNNVVTLLNDMSQKTAETAESFSNKIRNNFIAYITFFASTIIMNTISTGKIENIFTKDIATISNAFIVISFIYFILSLYEYISLYKRFKKNYDRQKNYYNDILSIAELTKIFNEDKPHIEDCTYLKHIGRLYSILWLASLIILFVVIRILTIK
ncbi:hypothetical protein EDD66_10816 [Mobilisporobacter senegalensis]|uniref:Uncharacterized protein n=1 Tax=Mobilisporobacter senegalensis TaxID=1329262 RepID=A0A3N1XHY2_9FIRM|nr:hypothetical protein [Mobilisporobacter senegalensis]ROR26294.1 hypothetical protein EDD66_10816 [Mobilisporobacter senegalensis]